MRACAAAWPLVGLGVVLLSGCRDVPPAVARPAETIRAKAKEAMDSLALTPAEQRQIGAEFHADILKEHHELRDARAQRRVERLGRPLTRFGKNLSDVHFVILADPEINAFSHVGGWVYVNAGLLDFARTDGELRFVLGHELGHIELGHCARAAMVAYRAERRAGEVAGALAGDIYHLLTAGYSQDQEYAADRWGRDACLKVHGTTADAVRFLHRIEVLEARAAQPQTPGEEALAKIGAHFRSHPPTAERIARLKATATR
jgi:putative metalloprotease